MTHRSLFLVGFLLCVLLISLALYFQYVAGLTPCPLCILQRIAFMGIGGIFLLGFLHNPAGWGRQIYAALAALAALFGIAVAGRHVWLQSLPEEAVPECGPGLEFIIDAFPLKEALGLILRGSGECAEVQWRMLGLSMPAWSLTWLILFALLCLVMMVMGRRIR